MEAIKVGNFRCFVKQIAAYIVLESNTEGPYVIHLYLTGGGIIYMTQLNAADVAKLDKYFGVN